MADEGQGPEPFPIPEPGAISFSFLAEYNIGGMLNITEPSNFFHLAFVEMTWEF